MNRVIVASAAGVAIVAAMVGCSSKNSGSSASGSSSASAGAVPTAVIVDGQNQNVTGAVTCTADGDNVKIGIGDAANGVGAVVSNADPPIVHAVGLGSVGGVALGFSDAAEGQGGNAGAAKSDKSYSIKGTATGSDSNGQPVTKPFELDVTCP